MNVFERPVRIQTQPSRPGVKSHGVVQFEYESNGVVSTTSMPVWIDRINLIANGMNFHTHRRVFRQLDELGGKALTLKINTHSGVRVYKREHHSSELEHHSNRRSQSVQLED